MSTNIEFNRIAVTFEVDDFTSPHHFLVHQVGNDRSFDHDGTIARTWRFYTIGSMRDIISTISTACGEIEGGMMRYANGSTKPENYIRNWRETIENDALSVTEFAEKFPNAEFVISDIDDPSSNDDSAWDAIQTVTDQWERTIPENRELPEYRASITTDSVLVFNELSDRSRARIDF